MINNTVKMSEFTEITQVDETTKIVVIQGDPAFNAYIDADLIGGGDISGETAARISADISLTNAISNETSARFDKDIELGDEISRVQGLLVGEVESRIFVDSQLSTAISAELTARVSGDNSLASRIYAEEVSRIDAISSEVSARLLGDESLTTRITAEESRAIAAEASLSTAINQGGGGGDISSETSARISGDQSLAVLISSEVSQRTSADASLTSSISTEASARVSNDNNLSTNISTEKTQRISGDNNLSTNILSESSQRISADGSLTSRISSEEVARTSAVSTESSQRTSADGSLTSRISSEEVARTSAVSTEVATRSTADVSLTTSISTETSQRISADLSLSNAIAAGGGGGGALATLSDVNLTILVDNDLLKFDQPSGKWINETPIDIFENVNNGELLMNVDSVILGVTPESIVSTEVSDRISGDTSLTTRISTEESTRLAGDASLSSIISIESSARLSSDNNLSTAISTESSARLSSDNNLSTAISTESSVRLSSDNNLTTAISTETSARISGDVSLSTALSITAAIAKGTQQALSFSNYSAMVSYLNNLGEPLDNTTYIGQSIYINTLDVPDVWISANIFPNYIPTPYFYVSDSQLISDVNSGGGYLQIGYYKISFLETQKVDLTNYVTTTALSTESSARVSSDVSLTTRITNEESRAIAAEASLSTAINQGGGESTTDYKITYFGHKDVYSNDKTYYSENNINLYPNLFLSNIWGSIYLKSFNPESESQIINNRNIKKVMVYGKYVLIHTMDTSYSPTFNVKDQEVNQCYLLNLSNKNVTHLGSNELTLFNYTDKLMYTRKSGNHYIYDLKTLVETQYSPYGSNPIMFPKSNTHCYILNGGVIGYYDLTDLSSSIWTQDIPGDINPTNFTSEIEFSAEYDIILGINNSDTYVYSISANNNPYIITNYKNKIQLSKDLLTIGGGSQDLFVWDLKTLTYFGKINTADYSDPKNVDSDEYGIYTIIDGKSAKIYK